MQCDNCKIIFFLLSAFMFSSLMLEIKFDVWFLVKILSSRFWVETSLFWTDFKKFTFLLFFNNTSKHPKLSPSNFNHKQNITKKNYMFQTALNDGDNFSIWTKEWEVKKWKPNVEMLHYWWRNEKKSFNKKVEIVEKQHRNNMKCAIAYIKTKSDINMLLL